MNQNKDIIFGIHAVQALLLKHPERVIHIYLQKARHDQRMTALLELAKQLRIKIELVEPRELDRLANNGVHQGVLALVKKAKVYQEEDLVTLLANLTVPPLLLILDGVQDPHNLGACLRSADAAGVHAVIVPRDKSVGMTSTVSKVACGAAEIIPFIQVTNLARTLRFLKDENIWIYGAAHDANNTLYQASFVSPTAIVLGSEGKGLRRLTKDHCDMLLNIPMQGTVSSLNVSVATGIFLFEALRQRLGNSSAPPPLS